MKPLKLPKSIIFLAIGSAILTSSPVMASSIEEQLKQMQEQIISLQKQVEALSAAKSNDQKIEELSEKYIAEHAEQKVDEHYATGTGSDTGKGRVSARSSDIAIKLGGFVRLDLITDDTGIPGNAETFDVSKIPVKDANGNYSVPTEAQTTLSARQSRFNIEALADTKLGTLKTYIEGDFFSSSNGFRLRHAYGEVGGFLAGQTWTTFNDLSSFPAVLDYNGVNGLPPGRVPQVRWSQNLSNDVLWRVALEHTKYDHSGSPAISSLSKSMPDIVSSLRYDFGAGHVQASGAYSNIDVNLSADASVPVAQQNTKKSLNGSAFNLSGNLNVGDNGLIQVNGVWTQGASQYIRGLGGTKSVADFDTSGNLKLLDSDAIVLAYTQKWNPEYASTFVYGRVGVDNILPPTTVGIFDSSTYTSANLVWKPDGRISIGAEYLWGERKDLNGNEGDVNRLNFMTRYSFD